MEVKLETAYLVGLLNGSEALCSSFDVAMVFVGMMFKS